MQPFDYRIAVQDPLQMALQGYMQGQQMVGQRVKNERETQLYDMEMQQYQANQAKLQQEQARAQEMQTDLGQFANDLEAGTATRDQLNRLKFKYGADLGEQVDDAYEGKTQEYKDVQAGKIAKIGIAFKNSPEEGMRFLQVEKEAARNAGDQQLLDSIEMMEGEAKISAGAPTASALFVLSSLVSPEQLEAYERAIFPERPELRETIVGDEVVLYDPKSADAKSSIQTLGAAPVKSPLVSNVFGPTGNGEVIDTGTLSPDTALVRNRETGELEIVNFAGGSAAAKAQGAAQSQSSLNNTLESMFLDYDKLQTFGAIRDVEKGVGANIAAYMQTSPLGREIGKATGSEAEAAREAIEALQPSISQAIMARPGMTATMMNSEKELAFFIKSITSPTTDVNTNYATLHALDMRFGSGQLLNKMLAQGVVTPDQYSKITRSKRVASVLGQLDEKVDELFTMDEGAPAAPAVPSRLQQYFGGD